jgi:nitrite reductase/ring-hydroxylating ferredoxin subunit
MMSSLLHHQESAFEIAAAWYVVMPSKDLPVLNNAKKAKQSPTKVRLFGQDLIIWRDQNGVHLMDAYCRHQGASLSQATFSQDGCVTCPFHGWRFDGTGQCVTIPSGEQIPRTALQRTFPVKEKYGLIWAWYGAPGANPIYDIPPFPGFEDTAHFSKPVYLRWSAKTTLRRALENLYDQWHLAFAHKLPSDRITVTPLWGWKAPNPFATIGTDGQPHPDPTVLETLAAHEIEAGDWEFCAAVEAYMDELPGISGRIAKTLGMSFERLNIRVDGWPGGHLVSTYTDGELNTQNFNCYTPVDRQETILNAIVCVPKRNTKLKSALYRKLFGTQTNAAGWQDVKIWNEMDPDGGGVYVKADAVMLKFRSFFQSWVTRGNFTEQVLEDNSLALDEEPAA